MFTWSRIVILPIAFTALFALTSATGGTRAVLAQSVASVSCSSTGTSSTCTATLTDNIRAGGSVTAVLQNGSAAFTACAATVPGQTCTVSNKRLGHTQLRQR